MAAVHKRLPAAGCRSARRWRIDFERDPRDELNYLPQNEAPPRAAL